MARLPSAEEIKAANEALQPYFLALGKVAHSWNHLHEELGKVFCAVTQLELTIGMAIWHGLRSDAGQRDILKGAVEAAARDPEWVDLHPGAEDGVLYLTSKTQGLANKRNDAIHAPCDVIPAGDFEIRPITFFQNQRAQSLRGKDILKEFEWYERTADALRRHATECRFALDGQLPWPDEPQLPTLGQEYSEC